jgi:AcrR family transcriptional regulator
MESGTVRRSAKEATRQALVQAALAEFMQRGFDAPSLDAICARAGYTRGAFYVHFKNRDELVAAAVERVLERFLDEVISRDDGDDDIDKTVMRFVDFALLRPGIPGPDGAVLHFHQILEACARSENVRAAFVEALAEAIRRVSSASSAGQRAGRIRDDVDPDEMAKVLVALALGALIVTEVELPLDVEKTRNAALQLLLAES